MYYRRNQCLQAPIILLLISGIFVSCSDPAGPEPKPIDPLNNQIVFVSDRDGNDEIFVMNADGSDLTKLDDAVYEYIEPAFSPDGNKIVFLNEYENDCCGYSAANTDGSGVTKLTDDLGLGDPVFSPDGSKITFAGSDGNDWEIFIMNADGSGQTNLTENSTNDYGPVFSPDGSKIVYHGREGDRRVDEEIYAINTDGSQQTNLTNNSRFGEGDPVFSPDGSKIAFLSTTLMYVMNADGSEQTLLTNYSPPDGNLEFSPDGAKIAYTRVYDDGKSDIFVVNTDGNGPIINLTNSASSDDYDHDWSPKK